MAKAANAMTSARRAKAKPDETPARAYEGYFEGGVFFAAGRTMRIPEKKRVVVTVFDESGGADEYAVLDEIEHLAETAKNEEAELRAAWIKKLNAAVDLSDGEDITHVRRQAFMREPVRLTDEG